MDGGTLKSYLLKLFTIIVHEREKLNQLRSAVQILYDLTKNEYVQVREHFFPKLVDNGGLS